jgi:hypothetical protein
LLEFLSLLGHGSLLGHDAPRCLMMSRYVQAFKGDLAVSLALMAT